MFILLALLQPALACDPVDFEIADRYPAPDQTVSAEIAPFVHAWTSFPVVVRLEDADGEGVPGTVLTQDIQGWSKTFRLEPESPLAPGAYTLQVDVEGLPERSVSIPFTVADQTPALGVASVRDLSADYASFEEAGRDGCDGRAVHTVELAWDLADAAATEPIGFEVFLVDGPDGVPDADPVYVGRADGLDQRTLDLRIYTEDAGPEDLCLVVTSLGISPEEDASSEVVCTESAGSAPGVDGPAGCQCSTTPATGGGLLAILGLGGLIGIQRRRGRA